MKTLSAHMNNSIIDHRKAQITAQVLRPFLLSGVEIQRVKCVVRPHYGTSMGHHIKVLVVCPETGVPYEDSAADVICNEIPESASCFQFQCEQAFGCGEIDPIAGDEHRTI